MNSRIVGPIGDGVVAVPSLRGIRVPRLSPHRGEAPWGGAGVLLVLVTCGSSRSARLGFLEMVTEARLVAMSVDFVLLLFPRRSGVPSVAGVEIGRPCTGGPVSSAVSSARFLQAVLRFAGDAGLTTRRSRGVSPADACLSSSRFRRPRRMAAAATTTRRCPLKSSFGDPAAACWCSVIALGATACTRQSVADRAPSRKDQGLECFFVFWQGPFCKIETAVHVLDGSCTSVFLS